MNRRLWDIPALFFALRIGTACLLVVNLIPVLVAWSESYSFADPNLDEVAYWIGIALLPVSLFLVLAVLRRVLRLVGVGAWLVTLGFVGSSEVPPHFAGFPMPAIVEPLDRLKVGELEVAAYLRNSNAFSRYAVHVRQEVRVFPGIIRIRILHRTVAAGITIVQVGEARVRCTFERPRDGIKEVELTLVPDL